MFSMLFSAMNLDKFILSIGPRDPPYSLGRQLTLTFPVKKLQTISIKIDLIKLIFKKLKKINNESIISM